MMVPCDIAPNLKPDEGPTYYCSMNGSLLTSNVAVTIPGAIAVACAQCIKGIFPQWGPVYAATCAPVAAVGTLGTCVALTHRLFF